MSEIRYVIVPPLLEVTIPTPEGEKSEPLAFALFLKSRIEDSGAFGQQGLDGILMAMAIRQAFLGSKPGDVIGLQLTEWDALCASTRKPTGGYNPAVMMQLVPYARAILDAQTTKPVADAPAPEALPVAAE